MNPYEELLARYRESINRHDWSSAGDLFVASAAVELDLGRRGVHHCDGGHEVMSFVAGAVARFSDFELRILDAVYEPDSGSGVCVVQEIRTELATGSASMTIGRYWDQVTVPSGSTSAVFTRRRYRSLLILPAH